jgi:hypothetical protein
LLTTLRTVRTVLTTLLSPSAGAVTRLTVTVFAAGVSVVTAAAGVAVDSGVVVWAVARAAALTATLERFLTTTTVGTVGGVTGVAGVSMGWVSVAGVLDFFADMETSSKKRSVQCPKNARQTAQGEPSARCSHLETMHSKADGGRPA